MLSINEIYRPEWETIYTYLLIVPSMCSIIMYPFVLYTVLFQAPNAMKVYKWMLANALTWSFLYELTVFFLKPYIMMPFYMGK